MRRGGAQIKQVRRRVKRRRLWLLLLALLLGFYSVALSQGWLDRTPPELYADVPRRAAAEGEFELFVSASEPVVYTLRFGDVTSEAVTQNLRQRLTARVGQNVLELTATDGAGNETTRRFTVRGVPEARVQLRATQAVVAGDPVGVQLGYGAEPNVRRALVSLAGRPLRVFVGPGRAVAFGSVPLGADSETLPLEVSLTDEFGRVTRLNRSVEVAADPREVEVLNLSPDVLSSSTPENVALEERTLEAAFAKGLPRPQWRTPFLFPTDGEGSSSFGDPRQYGPGGNVSYHKGADIAAPEGTPIYATNPGVVRVAGFYPIKGGLVVLDHGGGVFSLYFHQSKIRVKAGQRVGRGAVLGWVGTTGLSTGPHLHWELRVDGEPTNPLAWVGKVVP